MTQLLKHGLLVLVSLLDKNTLAKGNACFLHTNGGSHAGTPGEQRSLVVQ